MDSIENVKDKIEEIRDMTEYLIKMVTEDYTDLKVEVNDSSYTIMIKAYVPDQEKGRVIGKKGVMINAIRILLQGMVSKNESKKILFEINEIRNEQQ